MRYFGIEQSVKADGKTFRLSRFSRRLLRLWFEWAASYIENPLAIVDEHFERFPEKELLISIASDMMTHRFSFNDEAVLQLWTNDIGINKAFALLFDKYHADVDPDPIARALGIGEVRRLLILANGVAPVDTMQIERDYFASLGLLPQREQREIKTIDWEEFDASLFQNVHLTPEQIDELTPVEITVLCRKEETGPTSAEAIEHAKLQTKLTPNQILDLAKLKYETLNR
jgi:hypothetical protein